MISRKILLVDDAIFFRSKVRTFLEEHNYLVIEAENANQALEVYEKEHPDLVFLDVNMPGMDGLTLLKIIMEKYPSAKVVMLTARAEHSVLMDAITAGAKNYLIKPYENQKTLGLIKDLFGE